MPSLAFAEGFSEGSTPPADARYREIEFGDVPGWFVIGEVSKSLKDLARISGERWDQNIVTTPIRTADFVGLRAGRFALLYGAFPERSQALAFADTLKARKIAVDVKHSGALALVDTKPARRVRLFGRIYDDYAFPAVVEVDDARAFTDRYGWYQAWITIPVGETTEIALGAPTLKPKTRRSECMGTMDKAATVTIGPQARTIYVNWSPKPDCCDD